ncbi:MAG: FHA domain-containing protein [Dehalococcoidia bacterium]|nr:FHA domain-containing protein [Dehalococcoidia bacterium]
MTTVPKQYLDNLFQELQVTLGTRGMLPAGEFYEQVAHSVEKGNSVILRHLSIPNTVSIVFVSGNTQRDCPVGGSFRPGRILLPKRIRVGRRVIDFRTLELSMTPQDSSIRARLPITIEVDERYREDMRALGAILAHEDTHLLLWLLGNQRSDQTEDEVRTDMAAVVLGLGEMLANGRERYRGNGWFESMGYLDDMSMKYVQDRMIRTMRTVKKGDRSMANIRCQSCGSENNQEGDQFCGDCGTKLPPPPVVQAPPQPVVQPLPPVVQPPPQPVMQQPPPAPIAPAKAKLIVKSTGRVGQEFPIIQDVTYVGRWDADGGSFPEVDLSNDDPGNFISRKHARITLKGNAFWIEDLGSTNGTYLNKGARLMPGSPQELHSGDEIVLGRTFLEFVIL